MSDVTTYPDFERLVELQKMVTTFAAVERVIKFPGSSRLENDVDHSFGLALTCWFLAPKIAPELDLLKILQYSLAHDLVEIHAGDTFVFGSKEELATKSDREDAAIEQFAEEWPDFPDLQTFMSGYKNKNDEEAKFVYAVDKLLPVILVNLDEKDIFWKRHKITLEMQMNEKEAKVKSSKHVGPYYEKLVAWMSDPNYFYHDNEVSAS